MSQLFLGQDKRSSLYCPTHKGSNIYVSSCLPPVVRATPSDAGATTNRTSAEVLNPIIRRLPLGRRDFLFVVAPLQTSLSSLGFGRLACGW